VTDAVIHLANLRKGYRMRGEDVLAVSDLTMEVRVGRPRRLDLKAKGATRRVYAADLDLLCME
jgi:hypothetical protein